MPPEKKAEKKPLEPRFPPAVYAGSLLNSFGCNFTRFDNIHLLDDYTVLSAAGNLVVLLNIATKKLDWVLGRDGGGIGAVCVHPSRIWFAVAEKIGSQTPPGVKPNVYIYSYPEKEVVKTLRGGTENYYTAAAYSTSGDKLATVGGENDFMLTVWNWEQESVILRFKAWGSEVYRVTFNRYDDGFLTTSGNGHIKFWEMANTFTGLKLQGAIGKFGKVDIQDIVGYAELPDGKVVSGSQQGILLMWEANLLKVEIRLQDGSPCHDGPVEVVQLLEEQNEDGEVVRVFLSAGNDGYMKYWRYSDLDMADTTDTTDYCGVQSLKEVLIDPGCCIRSLARGSKRWLIQDANGAYWETDVLSVTQLLAEADGDSEAAPLPSVEPFKLLQMHAGPIACVDASPVDYCCVTGGKDGALKLWSFLKKREIYSHVFSSGLSTLQWLPSKAVALADLIVAGFDNGIVRTLRRTKSEFQLVSVWKPHTDGITSVSFSDDYKWAVTTSLDGTIFFFQTPDLGAKWNPVGEAALPGVANCSYWEGGKVVLGLAGGEVIRVECPDPAEVDHEVSFVFTCSYETLQYAQKPRPPEKPTKQRNLTEEDAEDDEEEEEEEEETEDLMEEDTGPLPVNAVLRMPEKAGNSLVIAMQHPESAYTFAGVSWPHQGIEVPVEEPVMNISFLDTVVMRLKLSPMGTYLILGCEQGTVILRDALGKGTSPLKRAYHINLAHDGRREMRQAGACLPGTVLGVSMSFDESILLTVSEDGTFLTHRLDGIPGAAEPPPDHDIDTAQWTEAAPPIPDIVSPDALSIQQTKDKEDRDRAHEAAEKKKLTLFEQVQELQKEYQVIVTENACAPLGKQISKEELELDAEITRLLHEENERKINEVSRQCAWDIAKAELAKSKLEETFVNCLKVDRIVLHAFTSGKMVSSFRTPQLTARQQQRIQAVHDLILNENQRRNQAHRDPGAVTQPEPLKRGEGERQAAPKGGVGSSSADQQPVASPKAFSPAESELMSGDDLSGTGSPHTTKKPKKEEKTHVKSQLEKAEERKRQRQERKALYDKLLAEQPQANEEDPKDVQAIQKAERNMGDKKLKTDANYVVKETERVTAERKERQLVLLEESINTLRLDFNERFLAMRDLKERLISSINRDLKKVDEINATLKLEEKIQYHAMRDEEVPDKLRQEPPDRIQLARFEKERAKARRRAERDAKAKAGFGGDLAGGDDEEEVGDEPTDEADKIVQARKASIRTHTRRESHSITAEMRINLELKTKLEKLPKSQLEQEQQAVIRHQLGFDKKKLLRKIEKTITTFDDALDELRREKLKLEGDLKMADLRMLLLYRELALLKEFKKRDEALTKKLEENRSEKLEVTKKTGECQDRLNEKKVEIKLLLDREQANMNEMTNLLNGLPQNMRDQLMRIFRKKVKRKQQFDGEEESEESSDDDWLSEEEDENEAEEEDACPEGCPEDTYEGVLALRLKRLEQEDIVADFQKSMDQLKKENESLTKREKLSNQKLQQIEKEIQSFQTEKQQKLNQLETSIVLKLSQVQALTKEDKLPYDQSDLIVFTNCGMRDLYNRILQLQNDKKALNREHNEHKRTHGQLSKEKRATEAHVKEWEQKVHEVQLLKFGQKVDLESLEDVSVDRQTEELKDRLREEEVKWERAMRVQVQALAKMKEQQQEVIAENSRLLKELADMRWEQQRLEEQLDVSQNKIFTRMAGGSRIATAADRANLKDLVVMQQREIDALKSEIAMLRRKGGHVYTPVVSKVVTTDSPHANTT